MEYEEILEKVIDIVADVFGVDADTLSENSTWKEDLKFDLINSLQSHEFVDLKTALDDTFEIDCPNMKLGRTKTLGELAAFIMDLTEE